MSSQFESPMGVPRGGFAAYRISEAISRKFSRPLHQLLLAGNIAYAKIHCVILDFWRSLGFE